MLDALKAITSYAAYQYHEEHGKKEQSLLGKYADFVVLDKNPLETDVKALADIQVLMTLKENEVVHHINKNKQDNRLENLQLLTVHEHCQLHSKERWAAVKGGD